MNKKLEIKDGVVFTYGSLSFPVISTITRIENRDGVKYGMSLDVQTEKGHVGISLQDYSETEIATFIKFLTGRKFTSWLSEAIENVTEKKIDDIAEPDSIQFTDPLKYI